LTAYIEQNVPDMEVNPDDYRSRTSDPLHRVRYSRRYFAKLANQRGLQVAEFEYAAGYDGQSFIYLRHSIQ